MKCCSYLLSSCICLAISTSCQPVVKSDLVPVIKSITPNAPREDDSIRVSYAVLNNGPNVAPKRCYDVRLVIDGKTASFDRGGNFSQIPPGDEVVYGKVEGSFDCASKLGSPMSFELRLDCLDADRSNNVVVGDLRDLFGK